MKVKVPVYIFTLADFNPDNKSYENVREKFVPREAPEFFPEDFLKKEKGYIVVNVPVTQIIECMEEQLNEKPVDGAI